METNVSLRVAIPADCDEVVALVREYYAYDEIAFDEAEIAAGVKRLLENPTLGCVFLVSADEKRAGYVILTFGYDIEYGGPQATVTDMFLRPEFRRRGLGTKTFRALEGIGAQLGLRALELQVETDNVEAQAFYAKLGFKAHSRLPMSKRLGS